MVRYTAKTNFGIFYQVIIFDIFFRQNDLKRLSAFSPNVIFGNIAVRPSFMVTYQLNGRMVDLNRD